MIAKSPNGFYLEGHMKQLLTLFVAAAVLVSPGYAAPKKEIAKGIGNMIEIETAHGNVEIELSPKDAPNTVARIKELVGQGFYNGLNFHRVVPGFVVQGGDPKGNGTGGSGKKLKAEFNSQKHVEGTVAMARSMDPDSADSQFYIALGTIPHLDNQYTVFGKVTKGMDAVKKIKVGDKMTKVSLKENKT